jgi:hypothetical protein
MRVGKSSLLLGLVCGCGGGQPLLHAAHPLPPGLVTVGAGVSGQFVTGPAADAISDARAAAQNPGGNQLAAQRSIQDGALAHAALAPGVAPWVSVRTGIGFDSDAGVTYSGRSVRGDARHGFVFGEYALSAGAGASAVLLRPGSDAPSDDMSGTAVTESSGGIRGVDTGDMTGWGLDLPILFGWRSDADLVRLWVGARAGYERVFGEVLIGASVSGMTDQTGSATASRWYAGGLVGLAVGIGPIWAAAELDAAYQRMEGSFELEGDRNDVELSGVSLSPGAALLTKF